MQGSQLAVRRQFCRAQNAYNLASALSSAFSTSARVKQDDGTKQRPAGVGSFASYEAISGQFDPSAQRLRRSNRQRQNPQSGQTLRHPPRDQAPQKTGLEARQVIMEREWRDEHKPQRRRSAEREAVSSMPSSPSIPQKAAESAAEVPEAPSTPVATDAEQLASGEEVAETPNWPAGVRRTKTYPAIEKHFSTPILALDGWKSHMQLIGRTVNKISRKQLKADEASTAARIDFDYLGKAIAPTPTPLATPLPQPWAVDAEQASSMRSEEVLEEEIKRFVAWAEPTPAEKAARQAVVEQTQQFITKAIGAGPTPIQTELFGSGTTGIALPTSDVDIRIYNPSKPEGKNNYASLRAPMQSLATTMNCSRDFITVVFRHHGFPIISAQHRATGIDVQIVSSPATAKQQAVTAQYLAELPHLRDLFLLMRTALGMRGLVDVFNGGTGSYGLFIMLVAALARRRSTPGPTTRGEQLLHFLRFYALFPYTTRGLTLLPAPKPFLKHSLASNLPYIEAAYARSDPVRAGQWAMGRVKPLQPYLLCLQDPADPTNDLGRKGNAIKHLQQTLGLLGERLEKNLWDANTRKNPERQWREHSFLVYLVGRCHEVYAARRQKIEEFGRGVLEGGDGGAGSGTEGVKMGGDDVRAEQGEGVSARPEGEGEGEGEQGRVDAVNASSAA